ncbi:MAG: hypothetical protein JNL98_34360 [Bryobacterales bacterium]|nr:hypothetical protein [Bryobacterales bacterium]
MRSFAFPIVIALLLPATSNAQSVSAPAPGRIPETHVLYHLLFQHLDFLNRKAVEVRANGKNGDALEKHYQSKIGLSGPEHAALVSRAAVCRAEIAKVDAIAHRLIADHHRQTEASGRLMPPPPPAELNRLQNQRDATVLAQVAELRKEMGETGFQKLDGYLKGGFARRVTVHRLDGGSAPDVTARRLTRLRTGQVAGEARK